MCTYAYTHILTCVPVMYTRMYVYIGMSLAAGGHLTHGAAPNLSGKWFTPIQYGAFACNQLQLLACVCPHVAVWWASVVNLAHKPRRPTPICCIARRCSTSRAILHPLPSYYLLCIRAIHTRDRYMSRRVGARNSLWCAW